MPEVIELEQVEVKEKKTEQNQIILFNDDHNTFDFVIECLINLCEHTLIQAEQCTMIVHNNGKCGIKTGDRKKLEPICSELNRLGLIAEIQ